MKVSVTRIIALGAISALIFGKEAMNFPNCKNLSYLNIVYKGKSFD